MYWCLSPDKNPTTPSSANFWVNNSSGIANPWDATSWSANSVGAERYYGAGTLVITKGGNTGSDSGNDENTSYAFSISGITNPAEANGNYIQQVPGVYQHETNEYYVSKIAVTNTWSISPTINPQTPAYANFFEDTTASSSVTNPWEVTEWTHFSAAVQPGEGTVVITKAGSDS
jgi:hypothetical protein